MAVHQIKNIRLSKQGWFTKFIHTLFSLVSFAVIAVEMTSCKKLVTIDEPKSTISTTQTFSSDANAESAIAGLYGKMINTQTQARFGSGAISLISGLSADELSYFLTTPLTQFKNNSITPDNTLLTTNLWTPAYSIIYQANACIEGLQASNLVSPALKNQLIGECKFIISFCNFYMMNLFGDIPLVLTTDWRQTSTLARSSKSDVNQLIISYLKEAKNLLPADYSPYKGERARIVKWAAIALLARVYLYMGDYANAEAAASSIIDNSNLYDLPTLDQVFSANNTEAILQLQPNSNSFPYAIAEANNIVLPSATSRPNYFLTSDLLSAFEINDARKPAWLKFTIYQGKTYYYPYKYHKRQGVSGVPSDEYYVVLRLAEQYLIRSEARANGAGTGLSGAVEDINKIRTRAGLSDYSGPLNKDSVLNAIQHERQIELFAEWGHRWLDLKRWNKANGILGPIKGNNWQTTDQLYPIPFSEIQNNHFLIQNQGY